MRSCQLMLTWEPLPLSTQSAIFFETQNPAIVRESKANHRAVQYPQVMLSALAGFRFAYTVGSASYLRRVKLSFKKAERGTEGEENKGWRFWLRAVLRVVPQRNRASLAKSSGVSRVYSNLVEEGTKGKGRKKLN